MAAFKDRLREARSALKLTQGEMARVLDLSDRGYRKLESGESRNPSAHTLRLLQEHTGRSPDWFLGEDDSASSKPGPRVRQAMPEATSGPLSAREAVLDDAHYLGHLMEWAGYETLEQRLAIADKLDARFAQFGTVTPPLVSLFLESVSKEGASPSSAPPRSKRKRGSGA